MNPDGNENQNNLNGATNVDPAQQVVSTPESTTVTNQENSSSPVQQAVFTPEPAPQPAVNESQDQPAITGTVVEPTQTGLSHQYYSNHPTKTSASGVGDIVVGSTKPQTKATKKRIWIIAGVFLGLIILISVIIVGILNQGSVTQGNAIQISFNKFANTMLYNADDDTADIPSGYEYGNLYFLSSINEVDEIKTYFSRAEVRYNEFIDSYKTYAESNPDNDIIQDNLQYFLIYYEDLDLFSYIELRPIISPDEFQNAFLDNPDLVSTRIEEYFAVFAESKVETTRNYAGEYKNMLTQLLVAFNTYQPLGCLDDRSAFAECLSDTTSQQLVTANTIYNSFLNFYHEQIARSNDLRIDVYRKIWFINEELKDL